MCPPPFPPPPYASPSLSQAFGAEAPGDDGFSDGIKMSRPTAVTHANCIVYRVCLRQTGSNLFCLMPFLFLFLFFFSSAFRRSLIVMSLSGALLLLSLMSQTCRLFIRRSLFLCLAAAGLPTLLHGLLQHLQHPHAVSVSPPPSVSCSSG